MANLPQSRRICNAMSAMTLPFAWQSVIILPCLCPTPNPPAGGRSGHAGLFVARLAFKRRNLDFAFPLSGLGDVVTVLHPPEGVHRPAKRPLDPQRHLRREVRALVEERRKRRPRH